MALAGCSLTGLTDFQRGERVGGKIHAVGEFEQRVNQSARVRTGGERDVPLADFSASERQGFGNVRQGNSCGVEQLPRGLRVAARGQNAYG